MYLNHVLKSIEMMLTVNSNSDSTIVSMLTEKNSSAWEQLYDKYAPLMYGAVFQITKDDRVAEKIFKECFLQLKESKNISNVRGPLDFFLLKHAQNFTLNYFKLIELAVEVNKKENHNTPLVEMLESKQITVKRSEPVSTVEQKEARKKLREEFNLLRAQHKQNSLLKY
jgi:DNA-directed RNA polymerase specialized sigma24 family protein